MGGLADQRAAIRSTMAGLAPTIGVVTEYEVMVRRKEDFVTKFKHADLAYMQGWTITREASLETKRNTARTNDRLHVFVIRGYRTIDQHGATETAFQDDVERVCDALRAEENDQLNATAKSVGPPSVRVFEPRDFSGYAVHYVEIACPAVEPKTF
jgi:hypothetical protein